MQTWQIHKKEIVGENGMVAAQHFEAAAAGARVLAEGGNAMDAAVVTALVLTVVEPWLSGLGGGGFLLHADGMSGKVESLDFNVRASRNLDPALYKLAGGKDGDWFNWPAVEEDRNLIGYSSICVPGSVAGLAEALERHGTLSWAEALAPVIAFAERGLEVDWFTALCLAIDAQGLGLFPATAAIFLDDGKPPKSPANGGARYLPMTDMARLLTRLAERGAREFYEGETAAAMVADLQAGGSPIDGQDLADYRPQWVAPAEADYRGTTIYAMPGLSGGPSFLQAMTTLAGELQAGAAPDARAALAYARAIRRAYESRLKQFGHAAAQGGDCTSHLSVIDRWGNMVSLTNTLLSRFGSKVVLPGAGILMNNGVMWYDPRLGVPNRIAPATQPLANMCPLILRGADGWAMAIGAAGGRQIFPALVQLVSYVADFGLSLEEAFNRPRLDASSPTIRVDRQAASDVAATVGAEFPVEIITNTLHPVNFAIPSAVMVDAAGRRSGMAHPVNPWAQVASEDAIQAAAEEAAAG